MTAMSRATRQIVVVHLASRGMTQQKIADELGISRDTVRRDIVEAPPAAADPAAPDAADVATLVLHLDEPLRDALAVLRSVHDCPDTVTQNVAAARAAIRATADTVAEAHGRPAKIVKAGGEA
ncbi:helix-turn-helix domain-containing protein [Streptomyces sp. NPDC050788]|uniref:helix-turn-helix domain-containing protein n=1 Tax=Streptomyces sp. NPDC050788 TaxID=3155041 RepID=UPI003422A458